MSNVVRACCLAACLAAPVSAQVAPTPSSSPQLAKAPLGEYRAWREPERTDWRAANTTAGELAGHVGQARGRPSTPAGTAAKPAAAGAAPPPAPVVQGSVK